MGHAVHFRDRLGVLQLEDVPTLEDALHRVEDLRNQPGVAEVRVFCEVPVEVRTYYRAVVADADAVVPATEAVAAPASVIDALPGATVMAPPSTPRARPDHDAELATTGDEPRRSRFARS